MKHNKHEPPKKDLVKKLAFWGLSHVTHLALLHTLYFTSMVASPRHTKVLSTSINRTRISLKSCLLSHIPALHRRVGHPQLSQRVICFQHACHDFPISICSDGLEGCRRPPAFYGHIASWFTYFFPFLSNFLLMLLRPCSSKGNMSLFL